VRQWRGSAWVSIQLSATADHPRLRANPLAPQPADAHHFTKQDLASRLKDQAHWQLLNIGHSNRIMGFHLILVSSARAKKNRSMKQQMQLGTSIALWFKSLRSKHKSRSHKLMIEQCSTKQGIDHTIHHIVTQIVFQQHAIR
jgi:hypothetical protein